MSITTSQWSHVLTIPESYTPSSATSGQTLVITESVIAKLSVSDQVTFWSNVQNGGGDVRICTDSGGVNQLPVEVVSLDNAAQTCVIWTRKPSYSGIGNLYLFIGKAGETQPPITDTFGRNAVWQDDTHRQGADGVTDVTGTTTISLVRGSSQSGNIKKFNAVDVDGVNGSGGVFDSTDNEIWTSDLTVSAWVNLDNFAAGFANIVGIRNRTTWEFSFRLEGNQPAMLIGSASPNSTGILSSSTDHMLHATISGSTIRFYLDGVAIGTASVSGSRSNRALNLTFGGVDDSTADGTSLDGKIAEARAINGTAIPSSKIETEYANQSDPASFFGTPTLATTGSAPVDYTITLDSGSYTLTGSDVNTLKDFQLNTVSGSYSLSGEQLSLQIGRNINLNTGSYFYLGESQTLLNSKVVNTEQGNYLYTGQVNDLTLSRFLALNSGTYSYKGDSLNFQYGQSFVLSLESGSYSYAGTQQTLLKDNLLTIQTGSYINNPTTVNLIADRLLQAEQGDYSLTGSQVNFIYETGGVTYTLSVQSGSYTKTGNDFRMLVSRVLPVDFGVYTYEGLNQDLAHNKVIALDSGLYTSAGNDIGIKVNRRLVFENGNYSLQGTPVTLSYSGAVLAILEGYNLSYKNSPIKKASYKEDPINIRYK